MTPSEDSSLPNGASVCLISPPAYYPWSVPPGLAYLSGYLTQQGARPFVIDANVGALEHVLAATHQDPGDVIRAFHTLRDRRDFYDWKRYAGAMACLSQAATTLSARHEERLIFTRNTLRYYPAFERRSRRGLLDAAAEPERHLFIRYYRDVLVPRVERASPQLIGLSASDLHQLLPATVIAATLRSELGSKCPPIVFGGNVFSRIHEVLSQNSEINRALFEIWGSVVVGEGERGLTELTRKRADTTRADRPDGEMRPSMPPIKAAPMSLDDIPAPRCDGFRPISPELPLPLNIYRGCYFSGVCQFCDINQGYDSVWATRSPTLTRERRRRRDLDRVVDDIRLAQQRYGTSIVNFTDEWFVAHDMLALADRLISANLGIRWDAYARLEPLLNDPAVCKRLFQSGLRFLQFGLETASAQSLQRLRKGTTPDLASQVLRTSAAAGIWNHVFVIVGLPNETLHDSLLTIDFITRHTKEIFTIKPTRFKVSRWSPLAVRPADFGVLIDQQLLLQRDLSLDLAFTYSSLSKDPAGPVNQRNGSRLSHRGVNAMYAVLETLAARQWAYGFSSLYPYHTRLLFSDMEARRIAAARAAESGLSAQVQDTVLSDALKSVSRHLQAEARHIPGIRNIYRQCGLDEPRTLTSLADVCSAAEAWTTAVLAVNAEPADTRLAGLDGQGDLSALALIHMGA
jgi:radical SAM superfamily enzyme YgiQ (UPF0313 family)